jgi:hypothetical protein
MATSGYKRALGRLRAKTIGTALTFFRAGRSVYVLILGLIILALGVLVLITSVNSREAAAANGGWDNFVAIAGSNQWVSGSFLIAASCIMLSVNYLPRLEGEA